ncbi:DUF928 domain-containing protein [Lyngbya sp. CCY1209]|jgi:hypothetical protein|uniref:DUF928 domain-containing protein n=1 Tax=Lyngbya sp. CCY1209 TaxID=2886103 RepID=UPI002D21600E|nr:DUF928 domain-containing protein [Lyngbya sp. CCY1209]MEB3884336.1 DUF928 domain-containing protein [Lyngbya sp. CCY1209]
MVQTAFSLSRATFFWTFCTQIFIFSASLLPESAHPLESLSRPGPLSPVGVEVRREILTAFEPPQRGIPGRREGGGTRGGCSEYTRLTSLIPVSTMGLTARERPQLFFYFPTVPENTPVEFLLTQLPPESAENPDEEILIHSATFQLDIDNPGIVGIDLASLDGFPALETGRDYHWYLSVVCDEDNPAVNPVVHGWVRKVDLNPAQAEILEQSDPKERLEFYTGQELWYDRVATFSELLSSDPGDPALLEAWSDLLKSADLYITERNQVELYKEPFVPAELVLEPGA